MKIDYTVEIDGVVSRGHGVFHYFAAHPGYFDPDEFQSVSDEFKKAIVKWIHEGTVIDVRFRQNLACASPIDEMDINNLRDQNILNLLNWLIINAESSFKVTDLNSKFYFNRVKFVLTGMQ